VESTSESALVTVELQGTDFKPGASGMLVMSRDSEYGVLIVDGLPELIESEQYQLWLIKDGERISGGVFSVNEEGYGSMLVASSAPLSKFNAFGITDEPKGGSPGPTGAKVLGS
jgi:anti-sigma-K factor RskA